MGISQRSPRGCWEFLRCVGMSCKEKKPNKHIPCAMSSTNFVLDILGKHSGKWNCSEPMRGRSCARARFFSYILPEILLAACMQSRCLHVRWLGHVCTWLCAGLCKANYGWKQLLSQQLGSSLPWVRLFKIKMVQIWVALVICKSRFRVITRNVIFQWGGFLSGTCSIH